MRMYLKIGNAEYRVCAISKEQMSDQSTRCLVTCIVDPDVDPVKWSKKPAWVCTNATRELPEITISGIVRLISGRFYDEELDQQFVTVVIESCELIQRSKIATNDVAFRNVALA